MNVLDPGHRYGLANLKSSGQEILQFYKDPDLHDGEGADGTSLQEVIRALIDRVTVLDREKPWDGNQQVVYHARMMLVLLEQRALENKVLKGLAIETLPTDTDGHLTWSLV